MAIIATAAAFTIISSGLISANAVATGTSETAEPKPAKVPPAPSSVGETLFCLPITPKDEVRKLLGSTPPTGAPNNSSLRNTTTTSYDTTLPFWIQAFVLDTPLRAAIADNAFGGGGSGDNGSRNTQTTGTSTSQWLTSYAQYVASLFKVRRLCSGGGDDDDNHESITQRQRRTRKCVGGGLFTSIAGGNDDDGDDTADDGMAPTTANRRRSSNKSPLAMGDTDGGTDRKQTSSSVKKPLAIQWDEGRKLLNLVERASRIHSVPDDADIDKSPSSSQSLPLLTEMLAALLPMASYESSLQQAWCRILLTCAGGSVHDDRVVSADGLATSNTAAQHSSSLPTDQQEEELTPSFDDLCEAVVIPLWAETEQRLTKVYHQTAAAATDSADADAQLLLTKATLASPSRIFSTEKDMTNAITQTIQLRVLRSTLAAEEDVLLALSEAKSVRQIVKNAHERERSRRETKLAKMSGKGGSGGGAFSSHLPRAASAGGGDKGSDGADGKSGSLTSTSNDELLFSL